MVNIVKIKSEASAYRHLKRLLQSEVDHTKNIFDFDGWPNLTLKLKGSDFDETVLTPKIMQGLLDFQKSIYHTYAALRYDDPVKPLTKLEREALQIVVSVTPGSTVLGVDLSAQLQTLLTSLVDKMDNKSITIAVVVTALTWGGTSSFKTYVDGQKQIRLADISAEKEGAYKDISLSALEVIKDLSKEETERARIIAVATKSMPSFKDVFDQTDLARKKLIKSFIDAESVEMLGVDMSQDTVVELSKVKREETTERRLDGTYKILSVDSKHSDEFRVRIRDASTGLEFVAIVQEENLNNRFKKKLQDAEWGKSLINLKINARFSRKNITKAIIMSAEPFVDSMK